MRVSWLAAFLLPTAQAADLATPAETMRSKFAEAALEVSFDRAQAARLVTQAQGAFALIRPALGGSLNGTSDAAADAAVGGAQEVDTALKQAYAAALKGDGPALARARARAWTGILLGGYRQLEQAIQAGRVNEARDWLAMREFRMASSLTRLNADATTALEDLAAGKISTEAALRAVRSDVLDGYQARLNDALHELNRSQVRGFRTLAAEQQALAQGYFALLQSAFTEQRGAAQAQAFSRQLLALPVTLTAVQRELAGFRAAPLSEKERSGRAAQVLRFLALVPVEYGRGVKLDGTQATVTSEVEVNEARTFHAGTVSAWSDIAPLLRDQTAAAKFTLELNALGANLSPEGMKKRVPEPAYVSERISQLLLTVKTMLPAEWQKTDAGADLDVIRTQLDAVVAAAQSGEWAAAETARLDAYSLLESGTEARIAVFNPELKAKLENLLWNGTQPKGLATLIREKGSLGEFKATRAELQLTLKQVSRILGTEVAPAAVATNAGIIVFREGLEAVLILAALMGSLRKGSLVRLRRPMWLGAAVAGVATAVTWFILQGALGLLGRYGEKLEAVVSLIAIGVLLLIMNWFFHQVYWTDRMASFQKHKHELTHGTQRVMRAQWWGLAVLGFTSIYREGFETVLFLQSLVLQAGVASVLSGAAVGLLGVLGVGVLVFQWQAKLPMKKLLIWTGALICAVLGVMVGNTVHTLQLVGWLPVHPLPLEVPAWLGLWFGLHPTWEGVTLQLLSMVAVVGSFFAAEGLKEREKTRRQEAVMSP